MRAVRGTVASSKSVSLSNAGAMLSDFVDSGVCSRREIAAYLRRASVAFDELVSFHREIKDAQKKDQHNTCKLDCESRSRKKGMRCEVESGDPEEIRGAYDANSVPKRRFLASGAKLVEDGGVPRKISASRYTVEKLVEYGNAFGFNGRDEKGKIKKEMTREIDDKKGIYFQMDLNKKPEAVKGHEKEEKKMKGSEKGEVYHVAKNNFDKKKDAEPAREHRNAMENKMEKTRHEEEKQNSDMKRKREGGDEHMSNNHENDISIKNVDFKSKEKNCSSKYRNNLEKHEEKGLDDISERHKKKKRKKEQTFG